LTATMSAIQSRHYVRRWNVRF